MTHPSIEPITPTGQNKYLHRGARSMETVFVDNTTVSTVCVTGSPMSIKMKTEVVITSEENITLRVEPDDNEYEWICASRLRIMLWLRVSLFQWFILWTTHPWKLLHFGQHRIWFSVFLVSGSLIKCRWLSATETSYCFTRFVWFRKYFLLKKNRQSKPWVVENIIGLIFRCPYDVRINVWFGDEYIHFVDF